VVVVMIYGVFEHVAMNKPVMAALIAAGTAFLAGSRQFPILVAHPCGSLVYSMARPRRPSRFPTWHAPDGRSKTQAGGRLVS
jgi:hypothetical protein